jgi:hypothetical protein
MQDANCTKHACPAQKTEKRQKSQTNEIGRQTATETCPDKMMTKATAFTRIHKPIAAKPQSFRKGTSTPIDGTCNNTCQIATADLTTTASQIALLNA